MSGNKGKVAFRKWYSCLREIRSLVSTGLPIIALTATASKRTKQDIFRVLELSSPFEVVKNPLVSNITYSTQLIEKGKEFLDYFKWLIDEVKEKGTNSERVLVYCQSIKQCTQLYQSFTIELMEAIFADTSLSPTKRIVEMLHSKTPKKVKENIIDSFSKEDGCVRVLFATIAFGMGIDAKRVASVIHVGPSKNIESYVQESGRCGRDGKQSRAILLYNNRMCMFCEKDIKEYVVSEKCKRTVLQQHFDFDESMHSSPSVLHNCCDTCAMKCDCNGNECMSSLLLPLVDISKEAQLKKRAVSTVQKETLHAKLKDMKESIVVKAMQGDQKERKATVISCPSFLLEFTDVQIKQVLDKCEFMMSIADVISHVEVWQYRHAQEIYKLIYEVFQDVPSPDASESEDSDESDYGDEFDWEEILTDESFLEMQNSDFLSGSFQISCLMEDVEEDVGQASYPVQLDQILEDINMDEIDNH